MKTIEAILFILPAYVANAAPTLSRGKRPLDFNRKFIDGNPIFGRNKTFEGLLAGITAGTLVAIAQGRAYVGLPIVIGALLGDLIGSFTKRRLGIRPGDPLPILDQLSFLLFALLLSYPIYQPSLEIIAILIVITPILHVASNRIAFALGIKRKPW